MHRPLLPLLVPILPPYLLCALSLTFRIVHSSAGKLPNHSPVKRSVIYERVHYALQFILDLVPTAAFSTLFPALISEFPHKSESKRAHVTYVTNLLRVIEYAPSLRNKLLTFITDRVIKIDTEIQADLDDLDDEQGEELEADIAGAEIERNEGGTMTGAEEDMEDEGDMEEGDDLSQEYGIDAVTNIKDTVDKLDVMLDILFSYYSKSFPNKSVESPTQESIESYELIMKLFNGIILPTYRSRYTQFLVFWAAQKAPRFSETFCVTAITKALDNTLQPGPRQAAAAYVASFIARAKPMPGQYVQISTRVMCRWLGAFVDQRSAECEGPDVSRWGGFYSVCQAVMYIFCFRWKDLREVEEDEFGVIGERWMGFLQNLNKAITSKFNPLKVCFLHIQVPVMNGPNTRGSLAMDFQLPGPPLCSVHSCQGPVTFLVAFSCAKGLVFKNKGLFTSRCRDVREDCIPLSAGLLFYHHRAEQTQRVG